MAGYYGALTIKARLLLLTGTLFVPCCGLILYAIWSTASTADASVRRGLLYSVQTISGAVDAELRRHVGLAEVLARSPAALEDDLSAFAAEVQRASVAMGDNWVLVADLDGKVLINTAAKPGRDLGSRTIEGWESQTRAIRTGAPSISDIFVGPNSHEWVATVDVPIFKDGRPFRCLAISMRAANFNRLLAQQQVPSDWLVGIIDASGRYVSRIPRNATQTGQFASEGWRSTVNNPGISEFPSIEGEKVLNANAHPTLSRWTVGVGIKEGAFASEISSTIRATAVAAVAISALALLLAAGIATSIARPLQEIGGRAEAHPAGRASDPPEIRALRSRLVEAELVRRRSERTIGENVELLAQARDMWSSTAEQLKLAAKYGRLGTFVWDPQTNVNSWSEEIEELYGLRPGTFGGTYEAWAALVHPEDLAQAEEAGRQSLVTGELHGEWRIVLPDGSVRWMEARARVLKDKAGAPRQMIGVNIDVTAAKEAERQRELLLRELAHRVKNSLAVVQSLAYQLLPRSEPKIADFMGRLHALASAHTSLERNEWQGADLAQLVRDQVLPFAGTVGQLSVDGPDLLLPAELTTQLALVIHELACNASKYGALSVTTGRIVVRWSRDTSFVHVRWTESGGPEASEPLVAGFGSRLLSRTVKNLHREFAATGLVCEFDIPWQEDDTTAAPAAGAEIKSSG